MEECGPCPGFASFTLAFALQLRKKHGKTCQSKKNLSQVKKILSQSTLYKLLKHPHITKASQTHILQNPHTRTHTNTHTLQNNIKPPQYRLKQNAYRKSNTMGRKNSSHYLMLLIHRYSTPFLTGPSLHFTNHKYLSRYTPI